MVKKAFIRTLEILIVIIVTTIFLLVIIPKQAINTEDKVQLYLINLEKNADFRSFVSQNTGCYNSSTSFIINTLIEEYLPSNYDYLICSDAKATELPETRVVVDTLFFAGNITSVNYKTVRLYYWFIAT